MRFASLSVFIALFVLLACQKQKPHEVLSLNDLPPLVYATPLSDSLPAQAVTSLHLESTTGVMIDYSFNRKTSYFTYHADKETLLRTIALLPFSKYTAKADTLCRRINHHEFSELHNKISAVEYENSSYFWNFNPDEYTIYECIKSPYKHTLILHQQSTEVFHRIEQIASL